MYTYIKREREKERRRERQCVCMFVRVCAKKRPHFVTENSHAQSRFTPGVNQ